jgi:hypothetical protein
MRAQHERLESKRDEGNRHDRADQGALGRQAHGRQL